MKCCICGNNTVTGYGNNPAPVKTKGRCCDYCNASVVIPARLIKAKTSHYEKVKAQVYATGNKWAIENFEATHN